MDETWRELLYPLGFLPAIAFTCRMVLQWLSSEIKGKSVVTPLFWKLSLFGNCLLAIHGLIQIQIHVSFIQACNAVISWRNLNLMKASPSPFSRTVGIFCIAIIFVFLSFTLQGCFLLASNQSWFRIPVTPWHNESTFSSLAWHIFGFVGMVLFSSRFWLQWWCAEKRKESYLGAPFWWISLCGEFISIIYFFSIGDLVNFIGPAFAFIPYIRNLILIYRAPLGQVKPNLGLK